MDNDWRSFKWSPLLKLYVAVIGTGTSMEVMTSPDTIVWTRWLPADDDFETIRREGKAP